MSRKGHRPQRSKMSPDRLQRREELRRSNAAGPQGNNAYNRTTKYPEDYWEDEEDE